MASEKSAFYTSKIQKKLRFHQKKKLIVKRSFPFFFFFANVCQQTTISGLIRLIFEANYETPTQYYYSFCSLPPQTTATITTADWHQEYPCATSQEGRQSRYLAVTRPHTKKKTYKPVFFFYKKKFKAKHEKTTKATCTNKKKKRKMEAERKDVV